MDEMMIYAIFFCSALAGNCISVTPYVFQSPAVCQAFLRQTWGDSAKDFDGNGGKVECLQRRVDTWSAQ